MIEIPWSWVSRVPSDGHIHHHLHMASTSFTLRAQPCRHISELEELACGGLGLCHQIRNLKFPGHFPEHALKAFMRDYVPILSFLSS